MTQFQLRIEFGSIPNGFCDANLPLKEHFIYRLLELGFDEFNRFNDMYIFGVYYYFINSIYFFEISLLISVFIRVIVPAPP